jgi:hypothetical protein
VSGPEPETFLSGESGEVSGIRRTVTRTAADLRLDAGARLRGHARKLDRLAAAEPPRKALVLSAYRAGSLLPAALERLRSERHEVRFALGAVGDPDPALADWTVAQGLEGGKFQNLNQALEIAAPMIEYDWLLVVDDDVVLPRDFLDVLLFCAERFDLRLAQPAHRRRSHAAWGVTRRQPDSVVRETSFVEIGPVTAFHRDTFEALLPFPDLRMGWGLDLHWAALARERGWRMGVVDAVPIAHRARPAAVGYDREGAVAEAREFLADRPYVPRREAERTLAIHRSW